MQTAIQLGRGSFYLWLHSAISEKEKNETDPRGIIEKLKFGKLREAGLQVAKLHNKTPLLCLIC